VRGIVAVCGAALALSVGACGSGGPAGTASHDSPAGAVSGLVDAFAGNDFTAAADWIAPDQRKGFTDALTEARSLGLKISFQVKDFAITSVSDSGDRATVKYSGQATFCVGGGAAGSTASSNCQAVQSQSGGGEADTLVCVRQDGRWYVSVNNTLQG
jgi:hypothetical protein